MRLTPTQIYQLPPPTTRTFPLYIPHNSSTRQTSFSPLVSLTYPNRGWILSPVLAAILCTIPTILVILLFQLPLGKSSPLDITNTLLGLSTSILLASVFQVTLKQLLSSLRPSFLSVCQPDPSLAPLRNSSGLQASGFDGAMYTPEICTNSNWWEMKTAMTSFPGGHATTAAASYVYLFMFVNGRLKPWSDKRTEVWRLALVCMPLLVCGLMLGALEVNEAHHWRDIVVGAGIGGLSAVGAYRGYYVSVWDWRWNHVPLEKRGRGWMEGLSNGQLRPKGTMDRRRGQCWIGRGRKRSKGGQRKGGLGNVRSVSRYEGLTEDVGPSSFPARGDDMA